MQKLTATNFARQFAGDHGDSLALTYLGVNRYANVHLSYYTRLERVQMSRARCGPQSPSQVWPDFDVSTGEALSDDTAGLVLIVRSISWHCLAKAKHHVAGNVVGGFLPL